MATAKEVEERLKRLGKTKVDLPEREPSLTQGPYPGASEPAPEPPGPEMGALQRAPLEIVIPMAGSAIAGAVSGPAAAATVPLVSGGLQMLGSEINRRVVAPAMGLSPPQPTFSNDPMREAAMQFGTGAAAEFVPGAIKSGVKRALLGPASPTAQKTLGAMAEAGVQPKVTDVAGGRMPGMMESFVRQTIPGSMVMTPFMQKQHQQLATHAQREFLGRLGPSLAHSDVGTGSGIKGAIEQNVKRLGGMEDLMWQDLGRLAGNVQVTPNGFVGWAGEVIARERAGLSSAQNSKTLRLAREIIKKATDVDEETGARFTKDIPFSQADLWRKDIGQVMRQPELLSGFDSGRLKDLYGGAMDDIEAGIGATGSPELLQAHQRVRAFGRDVRQLYRDGQVAEVIDLSPEQIVGRLQSAKGQTAIKQWKDAILGQTGTPDVPVTIRPEDQEAWNTARRHIFESILGETSRPGTALRTDIRGLPVETAIISGRKLQSELSKIGEEKLAVLLTPTERQALSNVEIVARSIEKGIREGSIPMTSITGQNVMIQHIISGVGGGLGALAGPSLGMGNVGGMVGGIGATLLAPLMVAKLLVNPEAVQTMASTGFSRLSRDFERGHLSREAAATLIRIMTLAGAPMTTPSERGVSTGGIRG